MRTIKFRGKRVDNGDWVYGYYYAKDLPTFAGGYVQGVALFHFIRGEDLTSTTHEVIPETVGQFTGLTNKNGNEIYEGDICVSIDGLCLVRWNEKRFMWVVSYYEYPNEELPLEELWEDNEIIGNIHDNPELLGTNI